MTEPKEVREAREWMIDNAPSPGGNHIAQLLNLFDKLNAEPVVELHDAGVTLSKGGVRLDATYKLLDAYQENQDFFNSKYRRIPEEVEG